MKKIVIAGAVVLVLVVLVVGLFIMRYKKMVHTVDGITVEHVDLSRVPDGLYTGHFKEFLVAVDVEVTVKDSAISAIEITEQECGPGYEARGTVDRIIVAQSPKVNAVSGATGSSKAIMIAVQNALTKKKSQ